MGGLARTFGGASAFHSHSGGGFGSGFGGFDKEVVYDPICDEWRGVTMQQCPIAFNFRLYEPLCKAGTWWRTLSTRTVRMWVIKPFGGSYMPCEDTVHFACPVLGRSCPSWLRGSVMVHHPSPGLVTMAIVVTIMAIVATVMAIGVTTMGSMVILELEISG